MKRPPVIFQLLTRAEPISLCKSNFNVIVSAFVLFCLSQSMMVSGQSMAYVLLNTDKK